MGSVDGTRNVGSNDFNLGFYRKPEQQAPAKIDTQIGQPVAKTDVSTGDVGKYLELKSAQIREGLGLSIPKNPSVAEARQIAAVCDLGGADKAKVAGYITNSPYARMEQGVQYIATQMDDLGTRGNAEAFFAKNLSALNRAFNIS